ncbi:MAG: alpha/beta hydrolase [Candidatus Rokuibacteriota bacterium]|nr:MAG: alpha/beta hydrolase [Candidatus Rokubacteria bacterium]
MKALGTSLIALAILWVAVELGMAQVPRHGGKPMTLATIEGVELEYDLRGSGEPVVLIHAGIFADWFKPLVEEPGLTSRYRVVTYHRIGYAGSSRVPGPVSIADQAGHLRGLMRHLGIPRAHLVGHSSGGNIALQLALHAPELVHSIVLMEPALPVTTLDQERLLSLRAELAPALAAYRAGDKARAIDGFMRGVSGPDYRAVVDRVLPGAFDQAVRDADTFFGQELPAIQQWSLRREDAARITQPVLSVLGAKSPQVSPIWMERHQMVLSWMLKAEGFVLPDATHALHVEYPRAVAEALAAFFARHPVKAP